MSATRRHTLASRSTGTPAAASPKVLSARASPEGSRSATFACALVLCLGACPQRFDPGDGASHESSGSTHGAEESSGSGPSATSEAKNTGDDTEGIGTSTGTDTDVPCKTFVRTRGNLDSYLLVPLAPDDPLRLVDTELFTVDMWGRVDPSVDFGGLYVGSLDTDPLRGWSFAVTSSTPDSIRATVASGFIHEALVGLAREWWHFTWQYDGMHSTLLVNDMLVNNVEEHIATVITSETHLYVGVSPAFADPRAGDLEGLRISVNGVPLAHWTFDEGSGPMSYDAIDGREIELYNVDWLEECD